VPWHEDESSDSEESSETEDDGGEIVPENFLGESNGPRGPTEEMSNE